MLDKRLPAGDQLIPVIGVDVFYVLGEFESNWQDGLAGLVDVMGSVVHGSKNTGDGHIRFSG